MTETAYYLVKEPLTQGYRVRMNVIEGLANMKASIGRVPQKNRFQLVGLNDDAEGREVTLVISTTVPCPECGMGDQSLYVLVEVSAARHASRVFVFVSLTMSAEQRQRAGAV